MFHEFSFLDKFGMQFRIYPKKHSFHRVKPKKLINHTFYSCKNPHLCSKIDNYVEEIDLGRD